MATGVLIYSIRDHPLAARRLVLLAVFLPAATAFLATFRYKGWLGPFLYTDTAVWGTLDGALHLPSVGAMLNRLPVGRDTGVKQRYAGAYIRYTGL
jgi:hypothetical protein